MLHFDGVSKRYGDTIALATSDIRLVAGRTTVLIGPSGCGKSTLLHMAAGLTLTDSGCIRFGETVLTRDTVDGLRRRIGYVIQGGGLFPHLRAARNVELMARHLGWSGERIDRRRDELTRLVQLDPDLLARYPAQLSGGQRQRVSLMRALMLDPEVLLLDEPLGALDPMIRVELQRELKTIFSTLGKTVLLVTHDLAEAAYFGDTIVLMCAGRVVQSGTFADLVRRPADGFVTKFVTAQREPARALQEALT